MGSWVAVRLHQPAPNVDAIGAWVETRVGDRTTVHEVTVGGGHAGGQLGWIHLGLGDADAAEVRVTVARRRDRSVDDGRRPGEFATIERGAGRTDPVGAGGTAMTIDDDDAGPGWPTSPCRTSACPTTEPLLPPSIYADRLERLRERMDEPRLRPARHLGRSRAQRQPRLPHRLRPAVRGGDADRRADGRAGAPRRQRVLRRRRGRAAAAPLRPLPGPQPARTSLATRRRRCPRSSAPKASRPARRVGVVGWKTYASRRMIEAPAFLVDELRDGDRPERPRGERHRPVHRRRRRAARRSTRSSSWPRSSGRRARPRTACATCSPGCARG